MADKLNARFHVLRGKDELVTSYYGVRTDPVTGEVKSQHLGIDLISEGGDRTVTAFADGEVTVVRNTYTGRTTDGSAGNYIRIRHADGRFTLYKHLKKDSLLVKKGHKVKVGQAIATMGDTGHATGVHLHFDVEIGGTRVDPLPYLRGTKVLIPGTAQLTLFGNRGNDPTLKWGTKPNADVLAFQKLMRKKLKYWGPRDGIAGNKTLAAAKKYVVGYESDGDVAQWVQQRLKSLGYYTGLVDGEPRSLTVKAIKALETAYGLTADGVISKNDWYYLLAVEG
ncbi:MAG: peptidoglycan DD-metalloendopeptidase family protein [Clostridia bacterium]|nr:peptidoglycan DD-metalloendopeptidase family protein [Clostridia bacterium]